MSMTKGKAQKLVQELYENITFGANNIILTKDYNEFVTIAMESIEEIQQYRAIGTVEEFKVLKEKNEPKKPIIHGLGQRYCPVCKCGGADHFYCARCGQKLG